MKTIVLGLVILASPITSAEQDINDELFWGKSTVSGCIGDYDICEQYLSSQRDIDMHSHVSGAIGMLV